jgi:hypothetical protein
MVKTRARRDDPAPGPGQLVLRGILGDAGLDVSDLRRAAMLNAELYGFYGVSVWVTEKDWPRERLEATKLVRFERYERAHSRQLDRARAHAVGHRPAPALRCCRRAERPGVTSHADGSHALCDPGQP